MSVVLVIAVGLFFMRDNIAKFINNAALQIAGEESNDGLNEYGFYFDKVYWSEDVGAGMILYEDGTVVLVDNNGTIMDSMSDCVYSYGSVKPGDLGSINFSSDGKTFLAPAGDYVLQE